MNRFRIRSAKQRALVLPLAAALIGSVIGLTTWIQSAAGGTGPVPAYRYVVFGHDGARTFRVTKGSVIAQGKRNAKGLCVIDHSVGVRVQVLSGDIGPQVTTQIDKKCRVVVTSIDPGAQGATTTSSTKSSSTSTSGGLQIAPTPAPASQP